MRTAKRIRLSLAAMIAPLAAAMALATAMGICLADCSSKPAKPGQYTSKKDGFTITAPKSWGKAEGVMGATVAFLEPQAEPSDAFRENVNVVVEKLPAGMGLDGYLKASDQNMAKMLTDYVEVSSARVKLGENDAQRIVYRHRAGIYNLKCLLYLVVHGGRGYVLTCTAIVDEYEDHEPVFEDTCKTFQTH